MKFQIEVEHGVSKELAAIFTSMATSLNQIINQQETVMADLSELQQEVEQLTDVVQSGVTLINGLADEIRELEPNQAAIDALASSIDAAAQQLADAIAANTPADTSGGGTTPPTDPNDPNAPQINPLRGKK